MLQISCGFCLNQLIHGMFEVRPPSCEAKFGPLLKVLDGSSDHFWISISSKFFDNALEFGDVLGLAMGDLGQCVPPEKIVQGVEVWGVGGPLNI